MVILQIELGCRDDSPVVERRLEIRDAAEGASGQRAERFFPGAARPDRRHGPSAGEAGGDDRLAVSGGAVRRGLFGQAGPTAAADKADGGLVDPQAHARSLRRGALCARWVENPYFQLFCGEEFFRHKLPFDRSSLTRWRQRMGEEKLVALIQESLNVATRTGAAKPADFSKVIVDTTVQPKAVAFPTDAKLMHRARERLVRLAKKHGVRSRQSYARVGKRALMATSATPTPSSSSAPTAGCAECGPISARVPRHRAQDQTQTRGLRTIFAEPLSLAFRCASSDRASADKKIYSLHAPEVECIGKGKAASALRVRRQGVGRDHAQPLEGRAVYRSREVHRSREVDAGQPL